MRSALGSLCALRYLWKHHVRCLVELGVVGKPNVGKSTFFAAATLAPVQIANYPFTTIEANRGVAFVRKTCPHKELGHPCKPKNAPCEGGARLTALGFMEIQVHSALRDTAMDPKMARWIPDDLFRLARTLQHRGKPMILAANKADLVSPEALQNLSKATGYLAVPTSAEYELALRRAASVGLIRYQPGGSSFEILHPEKLTAAQEKGLEKIRAFLRERGSTGVQQCIEEAVFKLLDLIVVYPVEDEHHWTDKSGNILPDAFLVPRGSTAVDVAFKVHTDLGNHFIRAINARTKMVAGRAHPVQDGDVIKILAKV